MPSRWMCLSIVAFWLTTTGWVFWNDVWPFLEPGQPPPFTIDLEEEAQRGAVQVRWSVFRDGQATMSALTWVEYREKPDDSFALLLTLKPKKGASEPVVGGIAKLHSLKSEYRVSRRGELRGTKVEIVFDSAIRGMAQQLRVELDGTARDGQFQANLKYDSIAGSGEKLLAPVPVSHRGSVMLPLHPVQRIEGLRRGQTWRMPMFNVLAASLGLGDPMVTLNARVAQETKALNIENKDYECLIVEYRGDEFQATTWVDEKTGLVLRQEQIVAGAVWAMQRETGLAR